MYSPRIPLYQRSQIPEAKTDNENSVIHYGVNETASFNALRSQWTSQQVALQFKFIFLRFKRWTSTNRMKKE